MPRSLVSALGGVMLLVANAWGFEVRAVVTKIDADQRMLSFTAGTQQRDVRLPQGIKVLDTAGQELADGLKSKESARRGPGQAHHRSPRRQVVAARDSPDGAVIRNRRTGWHGIGR